MISSHVVVKADVPNKNGRVYPLHILERMVSDLKPTISQRGLFGQIGMPEDSILRFSEASHLITDLRLEKDELVVDIEIMKTPQGKILSQLMNETPIVFRMAGVGAIKDGVIQDSYKLISIHAVSASDGS